MNGNRKTYRARQSFFDVRHVHADSVTAVVDMLKEYDIVIAFSNFPDDQEGDW